MRSIHVYNDDGTLHELIIHTDSDAEQLIKDGLLYKCKSHQDDEDHGHDLHLNPDHQWFLDDVERLLTSIKHQ